MAIKVSNTIVIDDSRNLVNVLGLKTVNGATILGSGDIPSGLNITAIKVASYTAIANDLVRINSSGGAFTITLPTAPVDGDKVAVFDVTNSCLTNNVLIAAAGSKTVEGDATGLSINVSGAYVYLVYNNATSNWKVATTPAVPPTVTIIRQSIVSTSSQTIFTLNSPYTVGINAINVFIDGVKQFPASYTETNSTTITFSAGVPLNSVVLFETSVITTGTTQTAGNIVLTPTGTVASTNVQAAIAELDSEKLSVLTGAVTTVGNAATVVTNANLTGMVTSVGNSTSLGSFTIAQLNTAVSDADLVSLTGTQTLTNKTLTGYTETVYALAGTDIAPANGTVQTKTLAANTTFTASLADGQSVILGITAGAFSVTWPSTTWAKVGGSGVAPTLTSAGVNWVILWQVGGVLRGSFMGTA